MLKDIRAKATVKSKGDRLQMIALLKSLLDVNVWIVVIFRLSSMFAKLGLYPISKIFWLVNRILFTVDIDPRANLAGGLMLVHGMNIVIGHEVRSAGRIRVFQGVTIGGNAGKTRIVNGVKTGQPFFANNVTVGINACVLGPVMVGEGSVIGTGAIVTKNVADGATIVAVNKVLRK